MAKRTKTQLEKYKDIEGQISLADLMDFYAPQQKTDEPPIMLQEGQKVYKVIRGDIEEHIVIGGTWKCGENNRGYRLESVSGRCDVIWNTSIGLNAFSDMEEARKKAEQYFEEHYCIRAESIKANETVAYRYLYNGKVVLQFYSVLEDGMTYYHYGSMYDHIGGRKEIKEFEKQMSERKNCEGYKILTGYQPVFSNMYKCNDREWKYAAARYQYING